MLPNQPTNMPGMDAGYVPYFYASGLFQLYNQPRPNVPARTYLVSSAGYDFTSDLHQRRAHPVGPSVEDVINRGYLSVPQSEPETAIISDKKHTSWLGLDDVIHQIRHRVELYQRSTYEIEQAKCTAMNNMYEHEAYIGPADSRVRYAVNKRVSDLYSEQREERVNLWRDISKLKQLLPEHAQNYLSSYRKMAILYDTGGDGM